MMRLPARLQGQLQVAQGAAAALPGLETFEEAKGLVLGSWGTSTPVKRLITAIILTRMMRITNSNNHGNNDSYDDNDSDIDVDNFDKEKQQ